MFRKTAFYIAYILMQTADRLVDFVWLYYFWDKTKDLVQTAGFWALLLCTRIVIFYAGRYFLAGRHFYGNYVIAFASAFIMIVLVNKISLEYMFVVQICLKEGFSAFRRIGTSRYLATSKKANQERRIINTIGFITMPVAFAIIAAYIKANIVSEVFASFALLVGPAMILVYKVSDRGKREDVETDEKSDMSIGRKFSSIIFMLGNMAFLYTFLWLLKTGVVSVVGVTIGVALIVVQIGAGIGLRAKPLSQKYLEADLIIFEQVYLMLFVLIAALVLR
jgi:hypothetical protein